jgi:hypothetical protein
VSEVLHDQIPRKPEAEQAFRRRDEFSRLSRQKRRYSFDLTGLGCFEASLV